MMEKNWYLEHPDLKRKVIKNTKIFVKRLSSAKF